MSMSLNEYTYEMLKKDIMMFRLHPGEGISAQKVAVRYNVSRTPAREAIIKLQQEGLLNIYPQSGSYVARININRARQEWFVRRTLEMGLAKDFIENCNDEVVEKMRSKQEEIDNYNDKDNTLTRVELDNQFHDYMYECSGQHLARELIDNHMTHYNRIRYLAEINEKYSKKTSNEHKKLIEAANKKDLQEFESVLKKHIFRIADEEDELIQLYPNYFESRE